MNTTVGAASSTMAAERRPFRADINALRALAILTVLGFHFEVPGFGGGFIGVDVFFVISGFLMTGIIVGGLQGARFSVLGFYEDRLLRIYPALAVLLLGVMALGAVLLVPMEYAVLGKNAAMAALFLSNLRFKTEYFGADIDQEWLLHTWSLSVEWQFYLVYPLVILALWRMGGRRLVLGGMLAGAVVSLALSWWLTRHMPIAAFYLLPSRAWEMLAGGLVWLLPAVRKSWSRPLQLAGLALIVGGVILIREAGWPGLMALVPVCGAALVIAANRSGSDYPGSGVIHWIGINSYSIYLWHWPIALWVRREMPGDWIAVAIGVALSMLAGHLSYRFVESPFLRRGRRARQTGPRGRAVVAGLAIGAALALFGVGRAVQSSDGWTGRFDPAVAQVQADALAQSRQPEGCFSVVAGVPQPCVIGGTVPAAVLIGDSHAAAAYDGLERALRKAPGLAFGYNAYASCPPVAGIESTDPRSQCGAFNRALLEPLMAPRTAPVLLVAYWQTYLDRPNVSVAGRTDPQAFEAALVRSTCRLAKAGPTYVMLPWPRFGWRVPFRLQAEVIASGRAADVGAPVAEALGPERQAAAMIRRVAATCGAKVIDPAPALCGAGQCAASQAGRPLFYDRHHLSVYGSDRLAPLYAPIVADAIRARGAQ